MKIIFLFSGEARTFPFALNRYNGNSHKKILESYNKFIFTEKFKKEHTYKIYITTDDLHLQDTCNYFGENNIGNIHLLNTNYYKTPIKTKSKNIDFYLSEYNKNDFGNCWKYDNSIYQHYKIIDCYNLFLNDNTSDINTHNCDYIIRVRLDVEFSINIIDMLDMFYINKKLDIILGWDFFAIGKPNIMYCYCNGLQNKYGKYNYKTDVPKNIDILNYHGMHEKNRWTYAPERQLFEMLLEYCNNNKLSITDTIKSIRCCDIIRPY